MKVVAIIIGVLLLVAAAIALSAVIIMLGWNVGVAGAVAAAGGHVSSIGFWTAVGLSFACTTLKSVFSGSSVNTNKE